VKTEKGDLVFRPLSKNLYIYKPRRGGGETDESSATNMLSTLKENKTFFTNRQVELGESARMSLQCRLKDFDLVEFDQGLSSCAR
jgi:hypothetical protein